MKATEIYANIQNCTPVNVKYTMCLLHQHIKLKKKITRMLTVTISKWNILNHRDENAIILKPGNNCI